MHKRGGVNSTLVFWKNTVIFFLFCYNYSTLICVDYYKRIRKNMRGEISLKLLKRAASLILVLAVIIGLFPMMRLFTYAAAPTVGEKVLHGMYSADAVTIDGELSESGYQRSIFLSQTLKVSVLWDWKNIYLAFSDTAAPAVSELKVNGMAVSVAGTAGATAREIQIPLLSVGITKPDLTEGYALSFKIGEVTWEGKLVFDTAGYSPIQNNKVYYSAVASADKYSVTLDSAATGQNANRSLCNFKAPQLQSSVEKPTIVELDVTVNNMPDNVTSIGEKKDRQFIVGGFAMAIRDEDTTLNSSNYGSEALLVGLCKENGELKLVHYTNGAFVTAPVEQVPGNLYHLRMEYRYAADGSVGAKYFVNDKVVAEAENVKCTDGSFATKDTNIIQMITRAADATPENRVNVVVSNLSVTKPQAVEAPAGVGDNFLFASYSADPVTVDGKLTEAAWRQDIPMTSDLSIGAIWDWHNLYLSISSARGSRPSSLTELKVNGVAVHTAGTDGTGCREFQIPLASVGIEDISFAKTYPIKLILDGKTWEGELVFDTSNYARIQNNKVYYSAVASADKYSVTLDSAATGNNANRSLCNFKAPLLQSSVENPSIVELDITVNNMPDNSELTGKTREFCVGGVGLAIRDEDTTLNSSNYGSEALLVGLCKQNGEMKLAYWADGAYRTADVQASPNNRYHLRVEYSYAADGSVSAKYFVNGMAVAEGVNVKYINGNYATKDTNIIQVVTKAADATPENRVNVVVANLSVAKPQTLEKPTDLDALTPEYIFGRVDLTNVQTNLPLIAEFTGKSGKSYPLTWVIEDTSILAADGKVTRHATEAKSTNVTLKADGMELWTVKVTIAPLTVQEQESSANVDAAFSASAITVDGVLNEEGWRMSGRILNTAKQLVAEYGFQWNQTKLFAAVDFVGDVDALALTLNGKAFAVENGKLKLAGAEVSGAEIAVNDGVVEIAIPMSVLGLGEKITDYGVSMSITVKAGAFTGAGKTLALTGIDWFVTDNREHAAPVGGNKSTDAQHGVTQIENGWRLFDRYDENGTNASGIRSYVLYQKLPVYTENFADRIVAKRMEFDFLALSMPVMDEAAFIKSGSYSNSGLTISMGDLANANKDSWTTVWGIINTKDGLQIVVQTSVGNAMRPLNKQVGEQFSVAVEWYLDNHLDVFVDGEKIHTIYDVSKYTNKVGDSSVVVNMRRSTKGPESDADSIDVYMTNIAFGKVYDSKTLLNQVTFDTIKGSNTAQDEVVSDLHLVEKLVNGQLDTEYVVTWTSSNPAAINPETGKVTQPQTGAAIVTLTASLTNGEVKRFELIVPGVQFSNDGVLHVTGDTNPAAGAGQTYRELLFTFDTDNNSIIKDLGQKKKVNYAVLVDGDDKARLNAESLTVWVSDDNVTYTQVESFKLLHVDTKWYLYDFEAEGRYLKVHYTHYHGVDANFVGAYGQMIEAGYEEVFGGGSETFTKNEYILKNESGKLLYDHAWTVSKEELGITGTDASIRIYLDGELLYHYVSGEDVIVRIPEVEAGASVKLTVKQSDSRNVLDIANKEGVYEVTYGTRETIYGSKFRWTLTLPAGTEFPDGSKLDKETIYLMGSGNAPAVQTSVDGGRTWTETPVSNNAPAGKTPVGKMHDGSFIFDPHTGRIMYQSYVVHTTFLATDMNVSHGEAFVIASDDGGKTWYHLYTLPCACKEEYKNKNIPRYALSYTEGTLLSTYDGKGEGIDFVFPVGVQFDNTGCFATRVAYTKDAGETWQYSESVISHPSVGSQGGCSEGWIIEREDGVLVLHTRCESADAYGFKVSYSLDHGLTWTNDPYFSDYYATNTQAMLKKLNINGEEVITAIWGGNNALGGTSYIRSPFNFAVSTNGGDTFRNIQNIFSKTHMECYDTRGDHYVTNHSVTEHGDDEMFITFRNLRGDKDYIRLYITDFDKWYTRTKGAYDNFEHGTVQYEGWNKVRGIMELSEINAQGKYSMKLGNDASATRSVPYLQNGKISVDVFVAADSTFTLALQNAYTNIYGVAMPIGLRVEGLKLYLNEQTTSVGTLKEGWNTLTFDLKLTEDQATVAINDGKAIEIPVVAGAGDYVCYITFGAKTDIFVDELLVTSDLEPVLAATEADQKAADEVIKLIQVVEKAADKAAAVQAARAAYDKLTQVQSDLVDRRSLAENTLVNYYELLVSMESEYAEGTAAAVEGKIAAIGTVTLKSKAAIEAARAAYEKLSAEQKALVKNYQALLDAEAALKALEEADKVIPPTGDTTPVATVTILMFLCTLAIAVVLFEIRRKRIFK